MRLFLEEGRKQVRARNQEMKSTNRERLAESKDGELNPPFIFKLTLIIDVYSALHQCFFTTSSS